MKRFYDLPLFVVLLGIGAISMWIPAGYALFVDDHPVSRAFLYSGVFFLVIFTMLALATRDLRVRRQGRSHLISILACFLVLPVMLAVPFSEAVPDTRFFNAYVEMVSSLTTTGLTLFEADRLPDAVHLWRAQVAWMGGFFIWLTAIAVMAPLNLGGFEISSRGEIGQGAQQISKVADQAERLRRYAARLAPVYLSLTGALWGLLYMAGDRPLVALCHAMSLLSTSGISPVGGLEGSQSGHLGEFFLFIFFIFALSRLTFMREERTAGAMSLVKDPEVRLGFMFSVGLALLLFARHWVVSFEEGTTVTLSEGFAGLWGSLFTVTSFLTTTGFESGSWEAARAWSGFGAPGVLLLGLAVFGGGVATTAGGVKLLRFQSLMQHSFREMEKLVQPSSIGSAGVQGRRFRRQGAYAAWVFFMLFALSICVVMVALSLAGGLDFEDAMILTIASLSTTGPLVEIAGDAPISPAELNDFAKSIVSFAMVVGRLEVLAIIALMNPEFWRH